VTHLLVGELEEVPSLKDNLATNDDTWRIGNKTQDGKSTHALAAGTLSNQPYTFPLIDIIGKTINGSDFSFVGVEVRFQVLNFKNFLCDYITSLLFTDSCLIKTG